MAEEQPPLDIALQILMAVICLGVSLYSLNIHLNAGLEDYKFTFFTINVTQSFIFFLVFGLVSIIYIYGLLRHFVFYPSQEKDDKKFEKKFIKAWKKSQKRKVEK